MVDQRIIELEHYINHIDDFTLDIIAEKMLISTKQLSRLLKTWDEQGLIDYTPGRGRGNKMKIEIIRDVQSEIIGDIERNIDTMNVKDLQKVLQQPWRHNVFLKLQAIVDDKINEEVIVESNELIEWVHHIPENLHPAHINDYLGAQLSHQFFDTLYRVSSTGKIIRNLVSVDEWKDNTLHIHLKKQVKFSDGTLLTAIDVKDSLDYCRSIECPYAALFSQIEHVEVINDSYLIIAFNKRPKYFEYLLTQKYSAIYRRIDAQTWIGSGPYQIDELTEDSLTIRYNLFYRGHLPDIERIKYVNKYSEKNHFDSYKKDNNEIVYINVGEEFLLFNPYKDLSIKQREYVSQAFIDTMEEFTEMEREIEGISTALRENEKDGVKEKIIQPLKVIVTSQTKVFFEAMQQRLLKDDVQLLFIEMDYLEYINTNLMALDVDFIWMYENYHSIQPYKTIDLLRQCKFQEWYGQMTEGYKIIKDLHYKENDAPSNVGYQYLKRLNQKRLYLPIRKVKRKIYVDAFTKNIDALPYGIVNYIDVILDKKAMSN
ncbi:hypothetical protein ETI08_11250 [Macrococcoides goetzii]|nr:ABC transporter substrate-binding protein [Macrococcus goetzii]TDM42779.1 hypothetical protein ETI08_11250 [Macrococcus goetzii]